MIPGGGRRWGTVGGEKEQGREKRDALPEALVTKFPGGKCYIIGVSENGYLQRRRTHPVCGDGSVARCNVDQTLHGVATISRSRARFFQWAELSWPCSRKSHHTPLTKPQRMQWRLVILRATHCRTHTGALRLWPCQGMCLGFCLDALKDSSTRIWVPPQRTLQVCTLRGQGHWVRDTPVLTNPSFQSFIPVVPC